MYRVSPQSLEGEGGEETGTPPTSGQRVQLFIWKMCGSVKPTRSTDVVTCTSPNFECGEETQLSRQVLSQSNPGEEKGRCFTIEYVMPTTVQMTSESTVSVLKMIRSATPFPLVSFFFMFIGFVLSNIGHIRPHHTILAFVSGIFFILSGLSLVVGLVLYISNINDEMLNRTKSNDTYFSYKYGWSFAFAAISFLLTEAAGVMSVYLFMKRYTAEEMYRPHQGFYRPRLSNCSDYSGQFLHPDAWAGRGRSHSSISSEASLPMNSSHYPALLKCPEYEQMSSSPC
ncbi:hypothetical protein F2P81_010471 [Scophthalmus maximus]|uniref:Voltage-dependent calcium channel gamma-5 subunit n=1 Tax=Scophthalmus maximus TaxID=52904 RepID=A0A6A4SVR2_SCOMX|nr:hypothetical protein F2P81_010471 [Scophthalmus maximus]